jgi:exopolysaccharide biosynthesis protein
MPPMRWLCFFLFLAPTSLLAEWRVIDRQPAEPGEGVPFRLRATDGSRVADLWLIVFRPAEFAVKVVISGEQYSSVSEAGSALDAVAGINGGYFREDGSPVGLLISNGKTLHRFESARLLSGVFFVRDVRPGIVRSQNFSKLKGVSEAVQAGPFLVENERGVAGLDNERTAPRTFVFQGHNALWGFGICRSVTLAEMGEVLLLPDLLNKSRIVTALNLDGGSSTQFWARSGDRVLSSPAFSVVNNYLLLLPKKK